jgi:hypothetical protein
MRWRRDALLRRLARLFVLPGTSVLAVASLLLNVVPAWAQKIPDVTCKVEDFSMTAKSKVQVVVLRDPAGEQEARFDLKHGATLLSLRYHGDELLYAHGAGANIQMYSIRPGKEKELEGLSPYWSALNPSQGGESFLIPSTTAGVACDGSLSMRAFSMMVDAQDDNSFQPEPLMGVWAGHLSNNYPPGYSTSYAIETLATWVANAGKSPRYYLRLYQNVVDVRPGPPRSLEWFLTGSAPWEYEIGQGSPQNCTAKTPCTSANTAALVAGRYRNAVGSDGVAEVVPGAEWATSRAYVVWDVNFDTILYPGTVSVDRDRTFATVLDHPMSGLSSFHFAWYICAGSWKQTKAFADGLGH